MRFQQKLPLAGAASRLSHPKSRIQMLKKRNSTAATSTPTPTGDSNDKLENSTSTSHDKEETNAENSVLLLSDCDSVLFHHGKAERRGSKSGDSAFTGNLSNYAWSQDGMDNLDELDDLDGLETSKCGDMNSPTDSNEFVPWGNDGGAKNENGFDSKHSRDSLYLDDDEEDNAMKATTADGKTLADAFARVASTLHQKGNDDSQEEIQSELELRIMAAQLLAAQAPIDSPLDLPEKYRRKSARASGILSQSHHGSDSGSSAEEKGGHAPSSPGSNQDEEVEFVPRPPQERDDMLSEQPVAEPQIAKKLKNEPESPTSSQRQEQRTASTGEESSSSVDDQRQQQQQQQQERVEQTVVVHHQKRKEERRHHHSGSADKKELQLKKRKEERRNRRSSCRQSKVNKALATKSHKTIEHGDDEQDTDTELMDQSSNTIFSASQNSAAGCDSHCSGNIRTAKAMKDGSSSSNRSSRRRGEHRSSRGTEHSAPNLPGSSVMSVPEQRPRKKSLTSGGPPVQPPHRSSLFGRLYNGSSANHERMTGAGSSAKPKTELMMLLEKGNTERDRYGDEGDEDSSDSRSMSSKVSMVKSISSALSFGLSLGGGGRSHKKKKIKEDFKKKKKSKHHRSGDDDGSHAKAAAVVNSPRRNKEDKTIALPTTRGTYSDTIAGKTGR